MFHRIRQGRSKLSTKAPAIALGAAVLLLIAGFLIAVANERAYKHQKIDEATVSARFLALIAATALEANDHGAAQQDVDALKTNPEAEAAAVYDATGALFARYARKHAPPLPVAPPDAGTRFDGNRLVVALPVLRDNTRLGTVYLDILTEPMAHRLSRYIGLGLLFSMAALLVVVLGVAHSALTRANSEIGQRARDLAVANRQLKAQIRERERAEEALRQSQKMEAIGRLTGGVAHDFNNLLTVIGGNLELLEHMAAARDGELPRDRMLRLVQAARAGAARGERLIRQLLALSRQEPLQAEIVDVNAAITDFAPLLQRAVGETVRVQLRLGDGKWFCSLDPSQFELAMLNIAINARDATEGRGTLTIATALAAITADRDGAPAAPSIELSVGDTGSGMPPEVAARVFEPFFTTKPIGKGSGFGLAQVWAFATQSGGRVAIDSTPGRGTTVTLSLPLCDAPAPRASETVVVEDEDPGREIAAAAPPGSGER